MKVIVEYLGGITRVIDTRERVVVRNPLPRIDIVTNHQSSPNILLPEGFRPSTGCEYRSWKRQEKHARRNWMRHPHRTKDTGGARIWNPLYAA